MRRLKLLLIIFFVFFIRLSLTKNSEEYDIGKIVYNSTGHEDSRDDKIKELRKFNIERNLQEKRKSVDPEPVIPEFGDLEFPLPPPTKVVNITFTYSPVTLDHAWSRLERLMFLLCSATFGSLMNGFFVASFFVEKSLKKTGNVFLACLGLSDLIMTGGVMPLAAVILLSGQWDTIPVCHALYFASMTSVYSYSISLFLVGVETAARLFCATNVYECFLSLRIGLMAGSVYIISAVLAAVGVYTQMEGDYCQRLHEGNLQWRLTTLIVFHLLPGLVTLGCLTASAYAINKRAREQPTYKRSHQYELDLSINNLNIIAFILYAASWSPFVYASYQYPKASNYKFYYSAWTGVFRSIITAVFYCLISRNFKRAFIHLFSYCFCKSSLSSNNNRHRRGVECNRPTTGDVRVHIMQALGAGSPQRSSSAARELQEF